MSKHSYITIPPNSLSKERFEELAASLFACGYTVRKRKIDEAKYKNFKCIEYWREEDGEKTSKGE